MPDCIEYLNLDRSSFTVEKIGNIMRVDVDAQCAVKTLRFILSSPVYLTPIILTSYHMTHLISIGNCPCPTSAITTTKFVGVENQMFEQTNLQPKNPHESLFGTNITSRSHNTSLGRFL